MTERLYYTDPALMSFDATIVECGPYDSDRMFTRLDRSAFYPSSGGQLHDLGSLGGVELIEVIESDDGDVLHLSKSRVGDVGDIVHGEIDRNRRNRNRQLHTAQHILSASFVKLYDFESVSVHLGEDYGAIELDSSSVTVEQVSEAERAANGAIAENIPVEILFVDYENLSEYPLRKIPERTGNIRIIRTGDLDCSACGGTHCLTTAEVGIIKIVGVEQLRQHCLVKFLAGAQAFEDYDIRFGVTDELSRKYTCHFSELGTKMETLSAENKNLRKEITALRKQLLPQEAEELAKEVLEIEGVRFVSKSTEGHDGSTAAQLAGLTADKIDGVVILGFGDRLVLAVGDKTGLNAGQIVKQLAASTDLKGGGSPRSAQAGGADLSKLNEYRDKAVKIIVNG